ncbi:hypothetical protein ACET3X_001667 [Alternaria dauci]|uniref:Rhodopsin domain-containing protein n=1 Tax=Alternaria dauci TaxID=48095 RepID=A0ABR3UYG5_9PLEO
MADPENLPTKHLELIVVSIFMIAISTFFAVWRLAIRFKISRWMQTSDWLMILGTAMNNAAISVSIVSGFNGAGRLMSDPFWQPDTVEKMVYQNHLVFASQLLNVYAMWIVKLSICTYLLVLNFSRGYRWVIWATIVFATHFNFVLPVIQHFGLCRPLASRWDTRITDKQCWSQVVQIGIAYTQAISNIITDLVYATAPIAYIRSVKLSTHTQWSVRIVFLMSLVCTAISAIKLWDFQRLQGLKEVCYESVTLSIWSMTEVSIGIVVANLPPLRKSFDGLLKNVLSECSTSRSTLSRFQSFHLPTYHTQYDLRVTDQGRTGRSAKSHGATTVTGDHESGKAIIEDVYLGEGKHSDELMRRSEVSIEGRP